MQRIVKQSTLLPNQAVSRSPWLREKALSQFRTSLGCYAGWHRQCAWERSAELSRRLNPDLGNRGVLRHRVFCG
jgi:hypothetical protein